MSADGERNFLGLALIVKNEEEALPRLLKSIEGAFDRIVLVDTGSKDKTIAVFEEWADAQMAAGTLASVLVDHFKWTEDFSEARQFAHARLGTHWEVWADADDELVGALNLRTVAENAPPEVSAYVAGYNYAQDAGGNCVCYLQRERLVRAGAGTWEGRVHEAQAIEGPSVMVGPEVFEWVHRKAPDKFSPQRNLKILRAWAKDEPDNTRVLSYLGTEYLARGKAKTALTHFNRYLRQKETWDEERAQVHRKTAQAHMALGQHDKAMERAFEAIMLLPTWPDSYLTLAEAHYENGELDKAIHWADDVLRRGMPSSLLILNPQDYTIAPLVVKCAALAQSAGTLRDAVGIAAGIVEQIPDHPLVPTYRSWRGTLKRNATAEAFVMNAQTLIGHDEQLKALQVLDAVPYYATDHPEVVGLRSSLRERLNILADAAGYAEHYETGGSKPEDFVEDPLAVGDVLPRCEFLREGLSEQAAA